MAFPRAFSGSCSAATETASLDGAWEFRLEGGEWRGVRVPHDWSIESVPTQGWGFCKGGKGEYRRTFEIAEADLAKHLELAFDGVFRFAEVYVNGELVGKGTRYGYTGFRLSLDGKVKTGKNDLRVKVDNSALPGCRWYMGSGIYRSVRLEKRAYPYVEPLSVDVRTKLLSDGSAEVGVDCGVVLAQVSSQRVAVNLAVEAAIVGIANAAQVVGKVSD